MHTRFGVIHEGVVGDVRANEHLSERVAPSLNIQHVLVRERRPAVVVVARARRKGHEAVQLCNRDGRLLELWCILEQPPSQLGAQRALCSHATAATGSRRQQVGVNAD